ncbi:MAG: hypothetical protein ACOYL6_03075 [Bacteriovoracaceae bacterium]
MKKIIALLCTLISSQVFAYSMGVSTHPFEVDKKVITTEATGTMATNAGSGAGIQARYYQRLTQEMHVDGGFGVSSSTATARTLFVGSDYMFFPEYQNQPRISLKGMLSNTKERELSRNNLGMAPTVSKGFVIQGQEIYPFLALPMGISLDNKNNQYKGTSALSFGATGNIPVDGFQKLTANLEANINLKNTYSSVFMGVSYPLN